MQEQHIHCGIYSFPKSGNTWVREIMSLLFDPEDTLERGKVMPGIYKDQVGDQDLVTPDGRRYRFYKSHSKILLQEYNRRRLKAPIVFNNEVILYITRNPLDVFLSQANFIAKGFVKTNAHIQFKFESVEEIKTSGLLNELFGAFCIYGTIMPDFRDAGSWMENVGYWHTFEEDSPKVIHIKYEDLLNDFEKALQPVIQYFGFAVEDISAIRKTADSNTVDGGAFFWKKSANTYQEYLSPQQVKRFIELHKDSLTLAGYDTYYDDYISGSSR